MLSYVIIHKNYNRYEVEVFIHWPWEKEPKGRYLEGDFMTLWCAKLQAKWHLKHIAWPITVRNRGEGRKILMTLKEKQK